MSVLLFLMLSFGAAAYWAAYLIYDVNDYNIIFMSFIVVTPFSIYSIIDNRRDLFSLGNVLLYFLIVSSPLFCVYVYHFANKDKYDIAMYWLEFRQLTGGQLLLFVGAATMFAGIAAMRLWPASPAPGDEMHFSSTRMRWLAALVIIAAVVAIVGYMIDTNLTLETLAEGLSKKRVHESTISDSAPRGSALTHWRFLGGTLPQAVAIAYLVLIWRGRIEPERLDYGLIAVLVTTSLVIPFLASTRTPILEIALIFVMLYHYYVRRISLAKAAAFAVVALGLLGVLGQMRQLPDTEREEGVERYLSVFEEVIAASYAMDLGKMSVLVERVPKELPYLYGSSLVTIVPALVPRQVWPEKPLIRIGFYVGQDVIQLNNETGIPPSFVGELYLNFGYAGVVAPMFLFGMLLGRVYTNAVNDRTMYSKLIYVLAIDNAVISLLPTDFTYGLFQALTYAAPLAMTFAITRERRHPAFVTP